MSDIACHPAALSPEQLLKQCTERRTRRSGPGGQHRNKVETAVILTHRPTGIESEAGERRSQAENRRVALTRLRINLAVTLRQPAGDQRSPSRLWRSRCRNGRVSVSPRHDDFPALLAEVLDFVVAAKMDVRAAAERLDCSSSQLVRFLKTEPKAITAVNTARQAAGQHRLC